MWVDRSAPLDLDGHVLWFCQPFRGQPTEKAWQELVDRIGSLHDEQAIDLLVIDSLANLAPLRSENDATQMIRALELFRDLTARGICTLITHHPKKGPLRPGQAARGSGALAAYVDIVVEMFAVSPKAGDLRRRLRAYSRHSCTPANLVMAWTEDGLDYVNQGTSDEPDFEHGWPTLKQVLSQADEALSIKKILLAWPDPAIPPSKQTLWRWLTRAFNERQVEKSGEGTRRDPYSYQLPGMIEVWHQRFLESWMQDHPEPPSPPPEKRTGSDQDDRCREKGAGSDQDDRCLPPFPIRPVSNTPEDTFLTNREILRGVLDHAPQKLTCQDILDEWPTDHDKPSPATLSLWLDRALERSLIACAGAGKESDPYRYWLPEREEVWRKTIPIYDLTEEQQRVLNLPFVSLREKKRRSGG
jgi:hypothetical protein